jgi:acetyl-CoA synthetase (ADP-forming)
MMHNIETEIPKDRRSLLEHEALQLLTEYGIPVPQHIFARYADTAVSAAAEIGFPVAMKVVSRQILHKSDVGGVRLGLESAEQVKDAWDGIMASVQKGCPESPKVDGMLIVEQLPPGLECVVGMVRDAQFGTAVMFGLGGVMVELTRDVSFGLLPLDKDEAMEMIEALKCSELFKGYRGKPPLDINAMASILVKIGGLADAHPEIAELDINPMIVYEHGVMTADARILLKAAK